jgi:uncharacterized protein
MATFQLYAWLASLLPLSISVAEVSNPRGAGAWISDTEAMIPDEAERRMNDRLGALERELGVEVAVVTVSGIDTTPKEFATALFNHWRIGKQRADNGLLVLLVRDQRRLEMETGYGLEPLLPDGWLGVMQNEVMVPAFKRGDFPGGLQAGLDRIDERLRASPDEAREGTRRQAAREDWIEPVVSPGPLAGIGWTPLLAGGGLLLVGIAVGLLILARRRERTCGSCRVEMRLLDEVEDDAHLDAGQRREEGLGSVDYRAYICDQCQGSRIVARRRWFSGHSCCPRCQYRTLRTRSATLIAATYDHGGQVQVAESCQHCDHHHSYIRHTARLTRSSSASRSFSGGSGSGSTSSSSSSFGGGRSGGGGAGSSW